MSNVVRQKASSQVWDTARTAFRAPPSLQSLGVHIPTCPGTARRAFSQYRPTVFPKTAFNKQKYAITRSFTSGGILLYGLNPATATKSATITSCSNTVEKSLWTTRKLEGSPPLGISQQIWARSINSSSRRGQKTMSKRSQSSMSKDRGKVVSDTKSTLAPTSSTTARDETGKVEGDGQGYFHLPHLPKMPHRPTKEELLSAATGFWSRLRVRFKWFSIRSVRPWNIDDWSAFVSWFLLGHLVWILVGTTTFVSLLILTINTVVAQETLAKWIGDYLTKSAGVKVVFESAIVPKWRDGVITFQNVFVSRRPGQLKSNVSKGSSMTAAAAAAAERQAQIVEGRGEEMDDGNYTQFDVTIEAVNVTLSFARWWNGHGLLRDVEVKGVRGVVDRTSVRWAKEYIDPRTYKHEHNPGDFEIARFKIDDLLLTVHQPRDFRPYQVSIFSCELPQLRKQWLFYDFLSANHLAGSFDGSLYNIHPHQSPSAHREVESFGDPTAWKKHSRLRIDGLKIDHLNRGVDGPFGWIHEGNVDIVADIMFPPDTDESIAKVMSDLYDRMEATVTSNRYLHLLEKDPPIEQPTQQLERDKPEADKRFLVMDLKVHLNDVRAAVPLFTRDLSYTNQALIRPIVAYINSQKTFIPISCRIVKRASEFDGSWTIFDSGLMEDLSAETYEAFAKDIVDKQARIRRLKKVGIWSIGVAVHALFIGMAGNVA